MMATDPGVDEELFDASTMVRPLAVGQKVNVRLSWGDEQGVITGLQMAGGYPMVSVLLSGATAVVNVANVSAV